MKVTLRHPQATVFTAPHRFRVLVAGRRFGKTYLAITELCQAAWGRNRLAWYVAPTYRQAKRIAWRLLKELTRDYWASRPNETDLSIELCTGGRIALRGADNYDSLRGEGLDFVVLDEYASMAPQAWNEVLRPALSDRLGRALFIGTPKGLNHFYDLFQRAQSEENWAAFRFTTEEGGNVPASELQQAAHDLDERTYRQEYQASFETLTNGLVYYAFSRQHNVTPVAFDPQHPLCWSLDFNVNPMCAVLAQIIAGRVHVLEELILPDSNTWEACEYFLQRTEAWTRQRRPMLLQVYGDAAGQSRHTSADRSDWHIVREFLARHAPLYQRQLHVPGNNPPVKARLNAVNALLCNYAGERRLLIHPQCKELIRDLERVCWRADLHGNLLSDLDKSDPQRTHASDALGYLIVREFPLRDKSGYVNRYLA